jgi:hypothetical protein
VSVGKELEIVDVVGSDKTYNNINNDRNDKILPVEIIISLTFVISAATQIFDFILENEVDRREN